MLPVVKTTGNYSPSIFDYFFSNNALDNMRNSEVKTFSPSVNISETDKAFMVEIAAPGIDKKDFNINVDSKVLTISYEHKHENEENDEAKKYHRREYSSSSFTKKYTLPDSVDSDKISAKHNNGVLSVEIPKIEAKAKLAKLIKIS